jgi:hypothetical protein
VVDVSGELVTQFGSNLGIALAHIAVRSGEAFQVRDGLDIPNDDVVHAAFSPYSKGLKDGVGRICVEPRLELGEQFALAESLQVAFDAGAKRLLLPMASVKDIPTIPDYPDG